MEHDNNDVKDTESERWGHGWNRIKLTVVTDFIVSSFAELMIGWQYKWQREWCHSCWIMSHILFISPECHKWVSKLVFYAQSPSAAISLIRVTEFHKCYNTEGKRSSHTCNDVCSLLHCFKRVTVRPHTLHSHRCRATVRPHTLHSHRCSEPAVLYRKWNGKPRMGHVSMSIFNNNNNNKGYLDLEHLTCTNPKRLHILYMTNMYTHTQLRIAIRAMGLK